MKCRGRGRGRGGETYIERYETLILILLRANERREWGCVPFVDKENQGRGASMGKGRGDKCIYREGGREVRWDSFFLLSQG